MRKAFVVIGRNQVRAIHIAPEGEVERQSASAWRHAANRPGSPIDRELGRMATHSGVTRGHRV